MVTIPESLEATFGSVWVVLPDDMRAAYEGAIGTQQARIVLALTGLVRAVRGDDIPPEGVENLRQRLAGLHLSQLEALGNEAEHLAGQLGVAPYAGQTSVESLLSGLSGGEAAKSVPAPRADTLWPVEPAHVAISGVNGSNGLSSHRVASATPPVIPMDGRHKKEPPEDAPLSMNPVNTAAAPEIAAKELAMTEREKKALMKIFGNAKSDVLSGLTRAQIDRIVDELCAAYIDGNKRKASAKLQAARWREHLRGVTDSDIADVVGISASGVWQSRKKLYEIIARSKPTIGGLLADGSSTGESLGQEDPAVLESAWSDGEVPTPGSIGRGGIEPPNTTITEEAARMRLVVELKGALFMLADGLGMNKHQKGELVARLTNVETVERLTKEASDGLLALATKFQRLQARGKVEITELEKAVFACATLGRLGDGVTIGVPQKIPLVNIAGMYREQLQAEHTSVLEQIRNVIVKMNRAVQDDTSS